MILKSVNGFPQFFPQDPEDLVRFFRITGIVLQREYDYFTFEQLLGLPRHSIAGSLYQGLPAIKTFEGRHPSDIFRENNFVFNMQLRSVVPMLSIVSTVQLSDSLDFAVCDSPLIQAGSILNGSTQRILSYSGWISMDYQKIYVFDREAV